jgi:hypothetical protein
LPVSRSPIGVANAVLLMVAFSDAMSRSGI